MQIKANYIWSSSFLQTFLLFKMLLSTKVILAGVIVGVSSAAIGWGVIPAFVKQQISQRKALVPGSSGRKIFEKLPFPMQFKAYIFNVTNPIEVHNGALPEVQEIGPFHYDEWKEKTNIIDELESDTVRFQRINTYIFNPEKSDPLTGEEIIFVPNPILLSILMIAEKDKPLFLGIINKALPFLFNNPSSVFLETTPNDLLFNGIFFNCTQRQEFSVNAVCNVILALGKTVFEDTGNNIFKFSFFGSRNGTIESGEWRVRRGFFDIGSVGQIISYNNKSTLEAWNEPNCNKISGSDGSIFPPFLETQPVEFFVPQLCRTFTAFYQNPSLYRAIPTMKYEATFGGPLQLPCDCEPNTECMNTGVVSLLKCMGVPVYVSQPHFLNAQLKFRKNIKGLLPDQSKHCITFELEPLTGTPLNVKVRIQFSIQLHPVDRINLTQNLPSLILPFLWFEEGVELSEILQNELHNLFSTLSTTNTLKWVSSGIGAGISLLGAGMRLIPGLNKGSLKISSNEASSDKPGIFSLTLGRK